MFSHKHLKDFKKNSNRAVNGLSTTSFVYTLIKLNAFFLCQSEKLKIITDFQINCNDHLIKSQSSNNYLSIDIDHNVSGERAPLLKRLILVWDICIEKANCLSSETRKTWSMALIQCHVDYFCSPWYAGISQVLKYKLQVAQHQTVCFIISMAQEQVYLPSLYRIPTLHKCPFKQRYIAGSAKCSTKPLLFYRRSKPGFRFTVTLATRGVVWIRCGFWGTLKIC
jgi:hypothetical protein